MRFNAAGAKLAAIASLAALYACAAPRPASADIIFSARKDKETHLFRVNPDTKEETQITKNDSPDLKKVLNMYPTVSKDGRRVAFASFRVYEDEGLRLWKQWNGDPLYPHKEYYMYFYSYYPARAYYSRHKSLNWNIYMIDMKRGTERRLSSFLWDEMEPQFMPRGTDILYVLTAEQSAFVLRGEATGKKFKQITLKDNQAQRPQISPNGKTMLYQSYRDYNWDVFTLPMNDLPSKRIEKRLTSTTYINELHPRWSPDGKKILFVANRPESPSYYDLCLMDIATGERTCLTKKEAVSPDAVFSPDGKRIAFTVDEKGKKNLYTMDVDGKNRKKVSGKESAFYPTWSPDGARVAYIEGTLTGKLTLFITGATGGMRKEISRLQCAMSPMVWF